MSWSAVLTYGGSSITVGDGSTRTGFNATSDGIEGWYSTPEAKWELTERSQRTGAYALASDDEIVYASRVITLSLWAEGTTRKEVVQNKLELLRAAGRTVTLEVLDGGTDMYVTGYATVEDAGGTLSDRHDEMVLTLECPDPFKYAMQGTDGYHSHWVYGTSDSIGQGGLSYGEEDAGLLYGLNYGDAGSGSVAIITNDGTMTAYPEVSLYGSYDDGVDCYTVRMAGTSGTTRVSYGGTLGGEPVVLDYKERRAARAGVDMSRYLVEREFRGIPAGETVAITLTSTTGDEESGVGESKGKAFIVVRDTFI